MKHLGWRCRAHLSLYCDSQFIILVCCLLNFDPINSYISYNLYSLYFRYVRRRKFDCTGDLSSNFKLIVIVLQLYFIETNLFLQVPCIRRGFRSIPLRNGFSEVLELSSLLVHLDVHLLKVNIYLCYIGLNYTLCNKNVFSFTG